MLKLPESIRITRVKKAEERLLARSREWLAREQRDPRLHVSDLLDPRLAYWQRIEPQDLPDRLVTTFLVGRILHAFILDSLQDAPAQSVKVLLADEGSRYHKRLGIVYSPDKVLLNGQPAEIKTSRSFYEPRDVRDLALYAEQLLCYMSAENSTRGQLWILFLNAKDEEGRTAPVYRCYSVEVSPEELKSYAKGMQAARRAIETALKRKDHTLLPLCRSFKCGARNCGWWDRCKPEGRYGIDSKQWTPDGPALVVPVKKR